MVTVMCDGAQTGNELSVRERALRMLPLAYSMALRLHDAGVADDVICLYVNVDEAALDGFYRIAEAKLFAAHERLVTAMTVPDAMAADAVVPCRDR